MVPCFLQLLFLLFILSHLASFVCVCLRLYQSACATIVCMTCDFRFSVRLSGHLWILSYDIIYTRMKWTITHIKFFQKIKIGFSWVIWNDKILIELSRSHQSLDLCYCANSSKFRNFMSWKIGSMALAFFCSFVGVADLTKANPI